MTNSTAPDPETGHDPTTSVEVVVTVRDHYSSTLRTVQSVLATTADHVGVMVVTGASSRRLRSRLQRLCPRRVRLVGPHHHLTANAARQLALHHTRKPWVAFVDNDVIVDAGWLDGLIAVARHHDALATRPVVLQRFVHDGPVTIHESGGTCRIRPGPFGAGLDEHHDLMHASVVAADHITDQPVGMLEYHCALFNRARLLAIGDFDTTIDSQGEHLDLTLRIHQAGEEIWLASGVRVTIEFTWGLTPSDISMFLGRWSPRFNERSRLRFNAKWAITNPDDAPATWGYAATARRQAWMPLTIRLHRLRPRSTPAHLAARLDHIIGRHVANLLVATAPGWRAWRAGSEGQQSP